MENFFQQTFTSSKSLTETPERGVKYVDDALVFLFVQISHVLSLFPLLTLNKMLAGSSIHIINLATIESLFLLV